MKLEVLLSTMFKENIEFVNKMNIYDDCIIINQTDYESYKEYNKNIKFISTIERGLSKSRNMAIKNSKADICLLADDDLKYVKNYKKIVMDMFDKNPQVDILCFCVEGINKKFKNYPNIEKNLNFITSMKVSSVEIAFRREKIINNKIMFKEMFGTGSGCYNMGEENIFLSECIKKKLKIKFVPIKIADLYIGKSSWFNGYNNKYFFDRGAVFTAMNKRYSYLLILQFAIRKYSLYKSEISFKNALLEMLRGRKDYKKEN